ncbi:MAG TPA: DUF547 domain-containing protein [Saprospiraceae bacterium]|nr:DUF547 domain-containing protein [Saprospiraceae bacterium]HRG66986.1 DUF547 domain-containing protein [Saprospiraceae bacterium]
MFVVNMKYAMHSVVKMILITFAIMAFPWQPTAQDYKVFDKLLKTYVDPNGRVNYKMLTKEKTAINQVLDQLQKINTQKLNEKARLAFYINLYNLTTLKVIADNYPIKSIKDIKGGKIWDIGLMVLNGKSYSLNELENQLIRGQYKEPRIHFLINCGAKSCPPLHTEAFTEKNIDELMDKRTRQFINDALSNTITPKQIKISKIFDWYQTDFGNLVSFINRYSKTKVLNNAKISFMDYDWDLNKQ